MGQRKNMKVEERCEQVLQAIKEYHFQYGFMPSYEDMMKATGIKSKGGHLFPIIEKLIETGQLEREPGVARGLRLPHANILSLTIKGSIAANSREPLVAFALPSDYSSIDVPRHLLPQKGNMDDFFVLQVHGNSMSAASILDGDYVVMQSGNAHRENDIVAVLLKEENAVTLKILEPTERGNVKVKPRSHQHQTRIEDAENIIVQGRVVAVMRKC